MNLNDFQPSNDGVLDYMKLENNNVIDDNGVSAYFRDIEKKLIEHIESANSVFGAIAWLTNGNILNALSSREHVQVVVQKEDFLRPDRSEKSYEEWKKWLHSCYSKLKCSIHRGEFEYWILGAMSLSKDYPLDPVRCVGYNDTFKKGVLPRMHNKFLVFANVEQVDDCGYPVHVIEPYAVWTGSFNFSKNATHSLENALYITNKKIVDAYFREYTQIAAISEKLDWTSEYIKPEWNIGV